MDWTPQVGNKVWLSVVCRTPGAFAVGPFRVIAVETVEGSDPAHGISVELEGVEYVFPATALWPSVEAASVTR